LSKWHVRSDSPGETIFVSPTVNFTLVIATIVVLPLEIWCFADKNSANMHSSLDKTIICLY
jgi:hypothetical protein